MNLGKFKREPDSFFDASERSRGQSTQRRIDYALFVEGCNLVALGPRVSDDSAITCSDRHSQREPPVMNRRDRYDADIQRVPVQRVIRNNQGRTVLVEA
jgi:hypothetical protein